MGGSFDPIHIGHLIIAQDFHEKIGFDELRFMPAAHAPLKEHSPAASAEHRFNMVKAAISGYDRLTADDREICAGGISYTINTVKAIHDELPNAEITLLIGQDHLNTLSNWHKIDELAERVSFLCADRPGSPPAEHPLPSHIKLNRMHTRQIDISSSEIQERIRNGLPVDLFLPESVNRYITDNSLYL